MRKFLICSGIFLWMLLSFSKSCLANTTEVELGDGIKLNVLTWNVQMLPRMIVQKRQLERAEWIIEELKKTDVDIVVLQELFDKKATPKVKKGLRSVFPYQIGPHNKKITFKQSTGVLVLSKIPIKYKNHIYFNDKKGIDYFANKGCVLIEGIKDGKTFQIAGTHLQAGGRKQDQKARFFQIKQIFSQILKPFRKKNVPIILVGDLNTQRKNKPAFRQMLETLQIKDAPPINENRSFTYDTLNYWNKDYQSCSQLDYVLIDPQTTKSKIRKQTIFRPKRKDRDGKDIDLADHYGILAEILIYDE